MDFFIDILRHNPVIPVFLTIGLGFWIGRMKFRSFSLGPVAATLIIGVIIGQLQLAIPEAVKSIFFMLFLFSIGYSVGPQFFRSFRGQGLKQVAFAFVEALVCACTIICAAKIMGYNTGVALGMFAGSQTASASLGVTSETIRGLSMAAKQKEYLLSIIPACYAVTYVFGTIGSAWFLSNIAPKFLGGISMVKKEAQKIEEEMDAGEFQAEPGFITANRPVTFRAYKVTGEFFNTPHTIAEIDEKLLKEAGRVFVERARINGEIRDVSPNISIRKDDSIVLGGRREYMVDNFEWIGPETADHELLSFGAEKVPVTISRKGAAGLTFGELRKQPYMTGVVVSSLTRNGLPLPGRSRTQLQRGDIITLIGLPSQVAEAIEEIGYSDRQTHATDMVFLGLGVAIGCFIGALSFKINGIPVSISTSGGALLSGLFLGWLRTCNPSFGRIPAPVIWIFDNLGLNMFIAVIGLTSGATFISGLKEVGFALFFIGAFCTLFALTVNIFIARKIFQFNRPETLGCVAGARCGVASIGAIQDAVESTVPVLGYTVTYAVANIVLVFSSLIVMAFV